MSSNITYSPLQVVDPKHWSNLTQESHMAWLGGKTHQYIVNDRVEKVFELNNGTDNLVSFINRLPSVELDDESPYRWKLLGADEWNIPLSKASLTVGGGQVTATDFTGIGFTAFYMWFPERYFEDPTHIVGENPEGIQLRILEPPVEDGGLYRYRVQIFGNDPEAFASADELAAGTRWKDLFAQTEQTLSDKGNGVHHSSAFELENVPSMIRKNYDVPGNMIGAKNPPLAMTISNGSKTEVQWINRLEYDFFTQFRRDISRVQMYGKSNKLSNGEYAHKGQSGYTLRSGFGLLEQMESGNIEYFNTFSLDALTSVAMQLSFGRISEDKREFLISTGEWGKAEIHKSLAKRASQINYLESGHNFKQGGKELDEGQITTYTFINGIKFHVIVDPMRDDPVLNTIRYKEGLASSYSMDIWNVGETNGQSNIERVTIKNCPEVYVVVPGIRNPFTPGGTGMSPVQVASMKDGYSCGKAWWGGVRIKNVKKTARFIPRVLMHK